MTLFRRLSTVALKMAALLTLVVWSTEADAGAVFDGVKSRGVIMCGVSTGVAGFSVPDDKSVWQGFDVDFCRAVAAAVFGDRAAVRFVPLNAKQRFPALQTGEIDILSRLTTWMFTRDVAQGMEFVGTNFFDGQGFLVRKSAGVKAVKDLDGATICVTLGTTAETQLADYFKTHGLRYTPVTFEQNEETARAYDAGRCDALTTDRSATAGYRVSMKTPADHIVLDEVISDEPLSPVIKEGDRQWSNIVRWTLYAMLQAEELGIGQKNVADMRSSSNGDVRRLLGVESGFGKALGLRDEWAYDMIRLVGNYGEIYDRNVGPATSLGLARGKNALVSHGGTLYSPPFR
jgi:general L-amino acid transport system substrate-binding protein